MLKAYKYRLYPKPWQAKSLGKHFGCVRFIYNWGLELKTKSYAETGKSPTRYQLDKALPKLKDEFPWLSEVNAQSLQQSLSRLDLAFTNFFRRVKEGNKDSGYPIFKGKKGRQSFQCPQAFKVDFENDRLYIPKVKWIKAVYSRKFDGIVKSVTVSRDSSGKHFASILVDDGKAIPDKVQIDPSKVVGIDLGLHDFLVTSDGDKIPSPKFGKEHKTTIAKLDRRMRKKVKESNRRNKARVLLAKAHERIKNQRKDFLHKASTKLIRENQAVCVEDLYVKGMLKNHCLAGSIGDSGWSEFLNMLEYKAKWYGKHILTIGRFDPSSKMCHCCGAINNGLALKDRSWTCPVCKVTHDRDVNAAKNIRNFALVKQNLIGKVPTDCREVTLVET